MRRTNRALVAAALTGGIGLAAAGPAFAVGLDDTFGDQRDQPHAVGAVRGQRALPGAVRRPGRRQLPERLHDGRRGAEPRGHRLAPGRQRRARSDLRRRRHQDRRHHRPAVHQQRRAAARGRLRGELARPRDAVRRQGRRRRAVRDAAGSRRRTPASPTTATATSTSSASSSTATSTRPSARAASCAST